jgi:hypothetical protein
MDDSLQKSCLTLLSNKINLISFFSKARSHICKFTLSSGTKLSVTIKEVSELDSDREKNVESSNRILSNYNDMLMDLKKSGKHAKSNR